MTRSRIEGGVVAAILATATSLVVAGCGSDAVGPGSGTGYPVRGVSLADWTTDGYAAAGAAEAVDAVAATGASSVAIIVTEYQATESDCRIRILPGKTPSVDAVRNLIRTARSRGLSAALKPHVDVDDGTWRARIDPDDPDAWFVSYRECLLGWAALAREESVDLLFVGAELAETLCHEARWRSLIAEVRSVFPGRIAYAACWDAAGRVPFWDAVDLVGVDVYVPVADRRDPSRVDLLAGWQPWLIRLERLHRQTGRPVLFSEIGYRSVDGAGMSPSDFTTDSSVDLREQADLYWAALEATRDLDGFAGMYWWNWLVDASGGPENRDFTPAGKPAEGVLARAWAGLP